MKIPIIPGNKIDIDVDSKFFKEYQTKWEEFILFKSNICDYLLSDATKIEELKKGGYIEDETENSYIEYIKNFAEKRSDLFVEGWAGHTASGVDGEEFDIGFNLIPTSNFVDQEKEKKFVPNKRLVIRFNKGQKAHIEFKNIEKLFLTDNNSDENVDSISSIDYSKSFMQLNNFRILDDLITTTSTKDFNKKVNNKEFGKRYENLKHVLENKSIGAVSLDKNNGNDTTEKNKQFFSPFLGVSIKSLTIKDVVRLQENKLIDVFKENAPKKVNINVILSNEKAYDSEIVEWVKKNSQYVSSSKFYRLQNQINGKYLSGKITTLKGSRQTIEISEISFNDELTKGEDIFSICYFSPFKKEGSDTYLKKEVISNNKVEIYADKDDKFYATTDLTKGTTSKKISIKCINDEELKKNLKFKHKIYNYFKSVGSDTEAKQKNKIDFKNEQSLMKITSDLSDFVKSIDYNNGQFQIEININRIKPEESYKPSFIRNDESGGYHLFVPTMCFETLFGRIPFDQKIYSINETDSGGESIRVVYTLSIKKILDNIKLGSNEHLRILSPFYHYKWFFLKSIGKESSGTSTLKTERLKNSLTDDGIVYEKFYNNFKFKRYEVTSDRVSRYFNSFKYNIIINGENIETIGTTSTAPNKIDRKGDLKGEGEKVLKVSENAAGMETRELDSAVSGPNSDFSSLDRFNAVQDALKDGNIANVPLILDFVELNRISEDKKNGEDNSKEVKNVYYASRNVFTGRRSNIQPKLLLILSKALEITQKAYPSLKKVKIGSSGTIPVDISALVYYLKNIVNNNPLGLSEIKANVNEYYPGLGNVLDDKKIKAISNIFINDGADPNHAMGFAADIYLMRQDLEGKLKPVCLWKPNDNNDFKIAKSFLQTCFDLGANGIGAGIYYMNYPGFVKHLTQEKINKSSRDKEAAKKFKAEYEEIYNKYDIEPAKKGATTINQIIIDNNGLPIRRIGTPSNAFHVQIFPYEYYGTEVFKRIENFIDLDELNKKSKKPKRFKTLLERIKANNVKVKLVWGENYSWTTADKWLRTMVGNKRPDNKLKGFDDVEEITQENVNDISKVQFAEIHKPETDKKGNIIEDKYVALKVVQKKEGSEQ